MALIYAAFIAGLCSIIYELLIATTAAYFLGDSVKYFSLTIGIYMASMGIGSFLSKYVDEHLIRKFILAEILLGILGGLSIPALYFAYAYTDLFLVAYVFFTVSIGFLIGLEIPFLTRLMQAYNQLKFNIANILSFDYLGALIATISFPFILLPFLGVYQSSLAFGLVNMSIGVVVLYVFADEIGRHARQLKLASIAGVVVLGLMLGLADLFLAKWDSQLYNDRIIYSQQTRYQKIVMTKYRDDIRLFLDGNLQFSSMDEYRYHESLVHVPLALGDKPVRRVLLLGAGDGLAVRELLKYPDIEEIVLVDLDAHIIQLATQNSHLRQLNENSLASPQVTTVTADAFVYLKENQAVFDFIIADLPDPNNTALARLYSKQFYALVKRNLAAGGMFVTQATSPYFATQAYWSIVATVKGAGFKTVLPYHALVPSFGDWGFVMAAQQDIEPSQFNLKAETRFLDEQNLANLFVFEKDMRWANAEVNMLDRPVLLSYYLKGWKHYAR